MAHGYLKTFGKNKIEVCSAGIETHGLNKNAAAAMQRDGVDISKHTSNLIEEYKAINFDVVITVCDNANEVCPVFSGNVLRIHQNFEDPSKFVGTVGTVGTVGSVGSVGSVGQEREKTKEFDRIRNQIKEFSISFLKTL